MVSVWATSKNNAIGWEWVTKQGPSRTENGQPELQAVSARPGGLTTGCKRWDSTESTGLSIIGRDESASHSVVSDSLQPHELYSPWNSPGQNTGVGSCSLLQGIFPTLGSNPGLRHCRRILYHISHQGSPLGRIPWPYFCPINGRKPIHTFSYWETPLRVGLELGFGTRIDAFELRCWRRLLRVLRAARRSNQ